MPNPEPHAESMTLGLGRLKEAIRVHLQAMVHMGCV